MNLFLRRFKFAKGYTLGMLFLEGEFLCFTCEDAKRAVKIAGETCIPAGCYKIELRESSPMAAKYAERFENHKGMLWLQDVPGFSYVYLHIGNTAAHSEGCILVGMSCDSRGSIGDSKTAYTEIQPVIQEAVLNSDAYLTISDGGWFK